MSCGIVCCVCGEKHDDEKLHHVEIKGETKKVCPGCATAIKGLA